MSDTTKPALPEPDGYFYEVDGYFGIHRQFDTAPYNGMRPHRTVGYFTADTTRAAIDAAVAEARAVPEGMVLAPHFRGYAHLGTGQYLLNHSAADEPAELVISIATDEQKAGREVGDDRGNPADAPIQPEVMAVRLRFENVAGLDALEKQLRYLRAEHFAATPSPAEQPKPAVVDLPDSIRVPLHRLWADAGYLIGRAKNGETDLAVHTIKALCDELERAIRAALQGEQP